MFKTCTILSGDGDNINMGKTFHYAAPSIWKSLPADVRLCQSVTHLKWQRATAAHAKEMGSDRQWNVWLRRHPDNVTHRRLLPSDQTWRWSTTYTLQTKLLLIGWRYAAHRSIRHQVTPEYSSLHIPLTLVCALPSAPLHLCDYMVLYKSFTVIIIIIIITTTATVFSTVFRWLCSKHHLQHIKLLLKLQSLAQYMRVYW